MLRYASLALMMLPLAVFADDSPEKPPTYTSDIAPLMEKHCVECHRPGEAVPMYLTSYKEIRPWVKAIQNVVSTGEMPPWHAAPGVGEWKNLRGLSDEEKGTLMAWIQSGVPLGDPYDLPPKPVFEDGWKIGEPDAIFEFPKPQRLPAELEDEYRYVSIKTDFKEDRWLKAVECRPGNTEVVHHIIAFCKPPGGGGAADMIEGFSLLGGYAPGMNPHVFEDGHAISLPKGSEVILQMHYHKDNNEPAVDVSKIGFQFADYIVEKSHQADFIGNLFFAIPPQAPNHEVRAVKSVTRDMLLKQLTPHMHVRGKDMRVSVEYPNGKTEDLISIPRYDFNWQTIYEFKEPRLIPKGSKLILVSHYDNSPNNPHNPDPTATVTFGEPTWAEMNFAFMGFSWADEKLSEHDPSYIPLPSE